MSVYNRYIAYLVLSSSLINVLLAFLGQDDITVYFTVNVIVFLSITLLYVYLNPRARGALNAIGLVFSGVFAVVVGLKVIEILAAR